MKTKSLIFGLALLFCCAGKLNAQDPAAPSAPPDNGTYSPGEFGIRFMPVFSTFDVRTIDNGVAQANLTMGYGFGALLGYNFSPHVGLQGEFIYNVLNQRYRDRSLDRTVTLNYINIPLLLQLNTGKGRAVNLNISAGPQVGINVGSRVESSGDKGVDTVQAILAVKAGDFGLAYGAGLEIALTPGRNVLLDFGFRGVYGLIDISDRSKSTTTNEYYILDRAHVETYAGYIGLKFGF